MPAWFAWSLLALVSWGVWAIVARVIGDALSPAQSQALSTLGMLPIIAILPFIGRKQTSRNPRKGVATALVAGILSCLGNVTYYHALNRGEKAATVVPLTAMYPLVTIVLAVFLLRERLSRFQLCGIAFSVWAIYLLNVSSPEAFFSPWMFYALLPVLFWGITGFLQKLSTNDIPGERSTLWFLVAFIPATALILWNEPVRALSIKIWLWVIGLGFFFALGNLAILLAFARDGKASIITPLTALYPLVSIPLAMTFLNETLSVREGLGILFALASVVALSWQRAPTQPRPINDLHHEIHK
jgi:bacterial/archaeal transporter family protein